MSAIRSIASVAMILCLTTGAFAGTVLEDREAPEWKISQWLNGDPGQVTDHQGRVVLIDFFQLWCPGCNNFSIPLFQRWDEKYGDRDDVLIISIHSVFEGHDVQTPQRLRDFILKKGITHPVGIDAYDPRDQETPISMKNFEAEGTPQIAIIGKNGMLRFNHFGRFDVATVEGIIDRLLKEDGPQPTSMKP